MTLCLYECLRAVGLHSHYASFTAAGVCHAAHLSVLTMEDYPFLGIRSMEDRTRLFHLIQMVKTLDLESLEYEDCDEYYGAEGVDEVYPVESRSIPFGNWTDPDEDAHGDEDEEEKGPSESELKENSFSQPSRVRRQLDFSCESINHQEELFSQPVAIVHASHAKSNGQSKESDIPVHLDSGSASAVTCSCKGSSNHRPDAWSLGFTHCTGANSRPDILGGIPTNICHTRLSPKCISSHKTKPRFATASSKKDRKGNARKEKLYNNSTSGHKIEPTPVYEFKRTAGYNYGLPLTTPSTPNKKKSAGQRISVCVRKRPLTRAECRRGEADIVTTLSGDCVIVHESKEAVDLAQYILQHRFYFDHVFGEESSNEEVYGRTAYPLVQHMLSGGKATCFAYGQTGAGKTHTMLGSSPGKPGLYALAVRDIFAHLANTHMHSPLLVYVSFFEIYCGQLYDLLDHRKRLFAREDGQKVVHIAGLRDVRVDSVSSLLEVISQGTEERTQGTSGVNPFSSRSHALLQIQLRDPNLQISGRMWFVDLAGSERASDTKEPDRQSRMEGAEINQSLLALKECIRSLDQEQSHTPFRQSKLTQVLKDSFVGDSMTCMIANISPGHLTAEHTLNTLRYADRVKELKGTKGERRKAAPSPKCHLSNSNSSSGSSNVSSPGKRSPKKTTLGRQREAFGQTTPVSRLTTGGTMLCSTPKNARWEEETGAKARQVIGLEQITPIRCLPQKGEKKERASRREGRRKEVSGGTDRGVPKLREQLVHGQQREQVHVWEVQRKSGFYSREKENQQSSLKCGEDGNRRWGELRRHVESSRAPSSEMERLRERDQQKVDERDTERERHLRWYHQQLQQFLPSPASSTDHFLSSNTSPFQSSLSSSVSQSSCSALQHSSSIPLSPLKYHGLEKVYRAQSEVKTERGQLSSSSNREISLQNKTSLNCSNIILGDLGGVSEDQHGSLEGIETGFRQNRSERAMGAVKGTGGGEGRAGMEGPAGPEGAGERRWAWAATAPTDKEKDRMTNVWPADVETQVPHNCDSEVGEVGLEDSAVAANEGQEEADGRGLVFTHSTIDNSLFNHSPVELSHQRAPAERPLSPAGEHADTLLTSEKVSDLSLQPKYARCTSNQPPPTNNLLPIQNGHQGERPRSCRDKEPGLNANWRDASNAQLGKQPVTSSMTPNVYNIPGEAIHAIPGNTSTCQVPSHSEVKANMFALAQGETSADSLSYTMDPLSISLLQGDRELATGLSLQEEQKKATCCLMQCGGDKNSEVENRCLTSVMAGNVVEDQDEEFRLSLSELPESLTHCSSTSMSMVETPSPRVTQGSLRDHGNNCKPQTTQALEAPSDKIPASVLKRPVCASMETPVMSSISSCVQTSGHTGSDSSQNQIANGATQTPSENANTGHNKLAFCISTPQSERALCQGNTLPILPHPAHPKPSNHSDISQQPNSSTESHGEESTNQQVRPVIRLSMLEDIYHNQWRVVQAHWEQIEEMELLSRKEGALLYQQPDMAFGEYVHKLGEILERKAQCVHSMITQLQPYLKTSHPSQPHNQGEDK